LSYRAPFIIGRCVAFLMALITADGLPTYAALAPGQSPVVEPGAVVTTLDVANGIEYLGGNFQTLGSPSGQGVPVSARTGEPLSGYPQVTGAVLTCVSDGEGGWIVGGSFSAVNGRACANLAWLRARGCLETWQPAVDGPVRAILVEDRTLYIAGSFTTVDGVSRSGLAAIDLRSGSVLPWAPQVVGDVNAMASHGSLIYLGGTISALEGSPRADLAAVDAVTGAPSSWAPRCNGAVRALCVVDSTVFLGGTFMFVNDSTRVRLAAVSATTGALRSFLVQITRTEVPGYIDGGPFVAALAALDGTLFIGGSFTEANGLSRSGACAVSLATGVVTAWDPSLYGGGRPSGECQALAATGQIVYLGGIFGRVGDEIRQSAAAVDARFGRVLEWNPRPNSVVNALACGSQGVYVGGIFTSLWSWVERWNLAAVRTDTGQPTDWAPNPDAYVSTLKVHGQSIYVSGGFSLIGGQPRHGMAVLDKTTGAVGAWDPDVRGIGLGPVFALEAGRGTVYFGGLFSSVGGVPRFALAAVDSITGLATSWQPILDFWVYALALRGDTLFVGGEFFTVNGTPRAHLAAISTEDASPLDWRADANGPVQVLALGPRGLFVHGAFDSIAGVARTELACVTYDSSTVTEWMPSVGSSIGGSTRVLGMVATDNAVYVGGWFDLALGEPRGHLIAFDPTRGAILDWDPAILGDVWALTVADGRVFAGGRFTQVGSSASAGLANFEGTNGDHPPPSPDGAHLVLGVLSPNPTAHLARLTFALSRSGPVTVEVFDIFGRRVVAVRRGDLMTAGLHTIDIPVGLLRAGSYLCRVEQGSHRAAKKLTVVK
jgi:hypothetical protein